MCALLLRCRVIRTIHPRQYLHRAVPQANDADMLCRLNGALTVANRGADYINAECPSQSLERHKIAVRPRKRLALVLE